MSNWSDVTTDGSYLYVTNSAYSQIDKYDITGISTPPNYGHQTSNWGHYGTGNGQLKQPQGISYAGTSLYVADTGNSRIQQFNPTTGAYVAKWGTYGTGDGQFNEPQGVAVDSGEDYIFVADTKNNRIQAIATVDGTVASVAGTLGTGENQFSSPKGIAVIGSSPDYTIYVADTGNNRIVQYTFNTSSTPVFNRVDSIGVYGTTSADGTVRFNQPNKISVDSSGYFYVTDTTNRVQKFNSGRNYVTTWNVQDSHGTTGLVAASPTVLYVIEPNHQIDVYNAQTGVFSTSFFHDSNQPVDISLDTTGNIYINNSTTNTVSKFSSSWVPMLEWGGSGMDFSGALGIGVNTGGEVCVADTDNNRVQRFDENGLNPSTLPTPDVTPEGFSGPKDVANEATGKMYIADSTNNRILKYKSDNTPDWAIGLPTPTFSVGAGTPTPIAPTGPYFLNPYGITVDTENRIYIADSGHHRIQKFDANGVIQNAWGEYGSADSSSIPQFDNPQGMAIDSDGNIYVADTGNNRIQRFDQIGTLETRVLWGTYGALDGQFNQPRNVAVDSSDRVYVSEVANRRIQVFGDGTLSAGLTVVETGATAVTEDGSVIDSYTVKLASQPSSNVTVAIASSDSTQLTVSSTSLTFTPYNWNTPQIVTVTPVHDYIDQTLTQTLSLNHTLSSTDANYDSSGATVISVQVTLTDVDTSGVTLSATEVNVAEAGAVDTYTIVLDSKPTSDVVITPTSADGQTTLSPTSLTFTTTNWNTPQTITVTAVHDNIANGARDSIISHAITTSDTSGYQSITPSEVTAHITDTTDVPGVTLSENTLSLTEGGASGTYTVVLNSKPTSDVVVTIAASSSSSLTLSPSALTFTESDYNTVQTVTVSAVNDHVVNTTSPYDVGISHTSASSDPNYEATTSFSGGYTPGNVVLAAITDIDVAGIVLTETDGSTSVIVGQTTDTYTIALNSKPNGNVVFLLTATEDATTAARLYTFTPSNWNTAQIATLSASNNSIYEGTHSATITHTILYTGAHDENYATGSAAILTATIYDTDYPGITITQPNGVINLTEYGITDTYFIKLKTQPTSDVTVTIDGGTQATPEDSTLVFTALNWNTDQQATLSAVNDYIVEGAHTATVTHTTSSSDTAYSGLTTNLTVNITDDDNTVPGIQIVQTGDSTEVTEAGPEDTYTMVLTSKPTAYVRIRVLGDNWEATTSGGLFTFLPDNWNTAQTVHVLAKDDPQIDGQKITTFQHIVTSSDLHYSSIGVSNVTVYVNDNDGVTNTEAKTAPSCTQTPPYGAPHLFQIDTARNSATLYFTPIKENITYYWIAYGYKPGDMRFGMSFEFGSYDGVIDREINMLDSGTTYYYRVRGGNGCAPGPWSNDLGATTTASGSAATRSYYAPAVSYASGGTSGGGGGGSSGGASHPTFTRNLYPGSRGADVRSLQMYLNASGFTVAQGGAGSPGNETDLYGPLTASAIRRFQEANYGAILSPLGYSSGTGIFGPSTRSYVNSH